MNAPWDRTVGGGKWWRKRQRIGENLLRTSDKQAVGTWLQKARNLKKNNFIIFQGFPGESN